MVNLASTPSEPSPYPYTEMLKDELVAGLALVDGLHQLRPQRKWCKMGGPLYADTTRPHRESGLKPAGIVWPEVGVHDLRHNG